MAGLGLLSRHKILHTWSHHLSYHQGPDRNRRVILHAKIEVPLVGIVNVLVVHFSYDRVQQCGNAAELLRFIEGDPVISMLLLYCILDMNKFNEEEKIPPKIG